MRTSPAELSPLDSKRFGIVVARAVAVTEAAVPSLLEFCERHGVELLIARCDGADLVAARALSAAGSIAVDVQMTYRGPLDPARSPMVREAGADDRAAVAELARGGFRRYVGHYHADSRLSADACADGYVDWALRGLAGDAADVCYLTELDGAPLAFGMFKRQDDAIAVVLAAVGDAGRGRELHTGMLHHGMAWGAERGAQEMVAVTGHSNIPAQRNFIKVGLRPVASTITFHGWRDQLRRAS